MMRYISIILFVLMISFSCKKSRLSAVVDATVTYIRTGSVTKGLGLITLNNLFSCSGGRVMAVGIISSSDIGL